MELVNILAYAIIILFAVLGLRAGFLVGLLRLFGWIVALAFSVRFAPAIAGLLKNIFSISDKIVNLLGGVIVFIAVIILLNVFVSLLKKTVNILHLGFLDRILGLMFGGVKAFILIFLISFSVQWLPISDNNKSVITDAKIVKWISLNTAKVLSSTNIDKKIKENKFYKKLLDEIKKKKKDVFN
ncbi:MAG: CvpA family protein [Candidatus Cloacimonadota bacterium]|nr:CvpA family protein [Candidatus Cloacimonadota bacterium]